tara:strand:+ start:282969 stop:284183 length:1215 start_codon:yes stop_codon:yes gene_type:complete
MKYLILLITFSTLSFALDYELVINEPGLNDQQSTVIEDKFINLLNQTPKGETVYLNIYGMKMPHIAKEVVRTKSRGVNIHILMRPFKDQGSIDSYKILEPAFPGNDGSTLSICGLYCSATAFNHNKFMLISKLKTGEKNIAIHTSNNFWDDERNNYNDFLIIKNNSSLYSQLKSYFTHLKKGRLGNWNRSFKKEIDSEVTMYTYPAPIYKRVRGKRVKTGKYHNYALDILNTVKCTDGAKVYFAHSRFTDDRLDVAYKLKDLKQEGCDVKVFLKNDVSTDKFKIPLIGITIEIVKDSPGVKVKEILGDILTVFPYEEEINGRPWEEGDPKKNALHSKIIMIHAPIKGQGDSMQKMVLVGTHNFDKPSLKLNNELLLKIQNDELYDEYLDSFLRLEADFMSTYGQ